MYGIGVMAAYNNLDAVKAQSLRSDPLRCSADKIKKKLKSP